MTKPIKLLLSAFLCVFIAVFSCFLVSADEYESSSHGLSVTLPDDYTLLTVDTAKDNADLIEELGYSVDSFKTYLSSTKEKPTETLFLAIKSDKKTQISLKSWESDFSKKIGDFSSLDEDSLSAAAKELVLTENATYKNVSANGMNFIEVRAASKDSGGKFCSVQYFTVRSGKFYSLSFTFSGKIDDQRVQYAWDVFTTLKIAEDESTDAWDFNSILTVVISSLVIIAAVVVGVIIIFSIVKDVKKRRSDNNEDTHYISRRK